IGLRIHEIITLEAGSLTSINGDMMFDTSTTKLHAERIEVLKPANELVVLAVTKLEEYSKPLRIEGESPYLFLNRQRNKKGYTVGQVSHSNLNKNYVRHWLSEYNFVDYDGNYINII